jgi:hypothetical protein
MHCILCIVFYVFYYMHFILCIVVYALYSIQCVQCIILYASYSVHCVLCIVFYALYYIAAKTPELPFVILRNTENALDLCRCVKTCLKCSFASGTVARSVFLWQVLCLYNKKISLWPLCFYCGTLNIYPFIGPSTLLRLLKGHVADKYKTDFYHGPRHGERGSQWLEWKFETEING